MITKSSKVLLLEIENFIKGRITDEVFDEHSYCFNVEDGPKIFDEAMKSQDVAFQKEAINDEMDSIMGNNTWGFKQKSRIDYFDTYAPVACISTVRLLIAMTSIHNLIIHQMDAKKAFLNGELDKEVYMNQPPGFIMIGMKTRPDIAFAMGKLSMYTSDPSTQHWQTIHWISNTEDNLSTSGWVFVLDGGAISWASKKQTCITGSIREYAFMALATAGKEAEWLRNLILKILVWSKPISPISIRCDSAFTLVKA
ncbi:zinc finger, CCHC-type containing protein [Tanacetum coccineum]